MKTLAKLTLFGVLAVHSASAFCAGPFAGSFTGLLNVPDAEDGTVFHLTLTSHAGSLDYVEQWFQKGNGAEE